MPARTYMVVDPRHDHGFRVPRPDLTVKLGTPNTCNACHADKPAQWAADAIAGRFGPQRKGFQTYAEAFHAVRNGRAGAAELLTRVVRDPATPSIARASALVDLGAWLSPALLPDFRRDLADPDPLVRIGALRGLERLPPQLLPELAARLLKDPVRTVRLEAVRLLARVPPRDFAAEDRIAFDQAAAEYIAAQRLNADRAEARTNLGVFFAQTGAMAAAEAEYVAAIRVEPAFIPATVNLADLYRTQQREADAERVLRQALAGNPTQAGLNHALGLLLVRLRRLPEALELLRKAAEVEPEQARYAYVYAVALDSAGRGSEAVAVLEGNQQRHPQDIDTLLALISINRTLGQSAQALGWAEKLYGIAPATPGLRQLLEELRRTAAPSGSPRLTPRR
jgi:Flp pilus assembly protein TadD